MATLRDYILKNSLSRTYEIPASVTGLRGIPEKYMDGVLVHRLGNTKEEEQTRSKVEFYYVAPSSQGDNLDIIKGEFKTSALVDCESPLRISADFTRLDRLGNSGGEFEKGKRLLEQHILATS